MRTDFSFIFFCVCRQVREIEAKGKAEREERAAAERTNEKRLKNHVSKTAHSDVETPCSLSCAPC